MESRGGSSGDASGLNPRPAITRRSCDQCRTRKIGCDRGSPCSNCVSARLDCTHSTIASSSAGPKQRVLISLQYEQKLDDIARSVDGIRFLLQDLSVASNKHQAEDGPTGNQNPQSSEGPVSEVRSVWTSNGETLWNYSTHIIDFVKTVVEEKALRDSGPETSAVLSSLRNLVKTLEARVDVLVSPSPGLGTLKAQPDHSMPPLDAVVAVLRWARDHESYYRVNWMSQMLPLERFTEICRKVYFAVDEYSEIDFLLANGYLSHVFGEFAIVSGSSDAKRHACLCRRNLHNAISRLPFLLQPSMDVIAALTLGAFHAIENSKAGIAWSFISTSADFCHRLGYHQLHSPRETEKQSQAARERLFWTVYKLDKGLALRFGRSPNIRSADIMLPQVPNEPRPVRVARIQEKVQDQLYSPMGLARPDIQRAQIAEELAAELREIIKETHGETLDAIGQTGDRDTEPLSVVYRQCEYLCQTSLHALILRAIPAAPGSLSSVSDECVAVAREALNAHHQCMTGVLSCKNDPYMVARYINWAILHIPFVPFSILFTRAVNLLDLTELAGLESFTASLQPPKTDPLGESNTHPHHLYELLCRAGRLYIESYMAFAVSEGPTLAENVLPGSPLDEFDFARIGETRDAAPVDGGISEGDLSHWYYGNQHIMNLLDGDVLL